MTTGLITAASLAVVAHPYDGRPWGPGPWFLLFPLTFWLIVGLVAFLVIRRRPRRAPGEAALADSFARGEIDEAQYRARLAILRETRR